MRASVQLPAFLMIRGEADSPSHALRAALAERLVGRRTTQDMPAAPPPQPSRMPSEDQILAVPAE